MAILQRHGETKGENITGYLGGRVPESLEREFKAYCRNNHLSVAAGLRLLVEAELKSAGIRINEPMEASPKMQAAPPKMEAAAEKMEVKKPDNKPRSVKSGRFSVEPWAHVIDGSSRLPCPLCGKWEIRGNISRHLKNYHGGITSEQLYTEYKEGADQMKAAAVAADLE